ncbi:hypothetical protein P7L53_04880 [Thermoleptolyngbya sichuanensis XZ-Cy5]|uniref:hypothetical protein n=1 Tax=Thermoleptolyngbya sichuanensis TaxID=2885951 RepID=UPI00240D45F1|nr:hypothetical protein [Thermoleptolyngbya sichuanensis]MDG2615572.1 hypothetical protein [Thermoleptolyngbya sichuanensis XZ-Cy5]
MAEIVECPSCGKKTVVLAGPNLYQCLSCDFKRDLSTPKDPSPNNDFPWIWITLILLMLMSYFHPILRDNRPVQQTRRVAPSSMLYF